MVRRNTGTPDRAVTGPNTTNEDTWMVSAHSGQAQNGRGDAARVAAMVLIVLMAAGCSHTVRPPAQTAPLLAPATATPVPPIERLKKANRELLVWSAYGKVRWVRPGQAVQERHFMWRESSGAWAVGTRDTDEKDEGDGATPSTSQKTSPGGAAAKGQAKMPSPVTGAMASQRGVFLVHANGQAVPIPDEQMTSLIHGLWGVIPVQQIRAWVLALPSQDGDVFTYHPSGLPSGLTPKEGLGWTVSYRGWLDFNPPMPQNVLLKGPDGTEVEFQFTFVRMRQPLPAPPGLSF